MMAILPMYEKMKTLLLVAALSVLYVSAAHAEPLPTYEELGMKTGWQYDQRRCAVGHEIGDFFFRISTLYPVEFDIMPKYEDEPKIKVDVASVQIDQFNFSARPGEAFEYSLGPGKTLLRALARGKRLQVFAKDKPEPVAELLISDGKKVATFLRRCGRK